MPTNSFEDLGSVSSKLLIVPNGATSRKSDFDFSRYLHSIDSSSRIICKSISNNLAHTVDMQFLMFTQEDKEELRSFFASVKGRHGLFWCPSWRNDFSLRDTISASSSYANIYLTEITNWYHDYLRIIIFLTDGAILTRRITAITPYADYEKMEVATPFDRTITVSDIYNFGLFFLGRFNVDVLSFSHTSVDVCTANLSFMEMIKEYPA